MFKRLSFFVFNWHVTFQFHDNYLVFNMDILVHFCTHVSFAIVNDRSNMYDYIVQIIFFAWLYFTDPFEYHFG